MRTPNVAFALDQKRIEEAKEIEDRKKRTAALKRAREMTARWDKEDKAKKPAKPKKTKPSERESRIDELQRIIGSSDYTTREKLKARKELQGLL